MTRFEKMKVYMGDYRSRLRWCKADACACMGCEVKFEWKWKEMFPEEEPITEEDVIEFNSLLDSLKV